MPCDKNSKKCELNNYGEMPACCKQHLLETINYTSKLLAENGVKHWLDYGTLLGAVRDRDIIPWDSDADFGMLADDRETILNLKRRIKRDGFCLYEYSEHLLQIGYSCSNWSYVDLWLNHIETARDHKPNDTGNLPADYPPIDKRKINRNFKICKCYGPGNQLDHTSDFPYWFIEETDTIRLKGYKLPCPRIREHFLTMRYGNWKKVIKKEDSYWGGNALTLRQSLDIVKRHKRTLG